MENQHFFKPLLPGFHSHLTIPEAFFLRNIKGRYEQETVELRSEASDITWKVKIDGQRLTEGWKEFALAHDLRIGDILVFRHEGDMAFHVTHLGPSCCEIQYGPCLDKQNNLEKNPKREAESTSLDPSCFVASVPPSSLRYDRMNLPRPFVRENGVVVGSGEIVLMNENGQSWTLNLKHKPSCGAIYISRGWTSFCGANGLREGDIVSFKLIKGEEILVLRLSSKQLDEEANEEENLRKIHGKKKKPRRDTESSSLDPSCFVTNIAPSTLRYDTLYLPKKFVTANDIGIRKCGDMILMNEKGKTWTLDLRHKKPCGTAMIKRGWRSFCSANGLKAGTCITFRLIKKGGTLVLRLTPNEQEQDKEAGGESSEANSQECSRKMEKKGGLRWKASSLPSQNRFVTLTLTAYNISSSVLRLPAPFTRMNGINKETKMALLDKHGVKWSTSLKLEGRNSKRLRMTGGWKGFFKANCVKTNESVKLELIWEEETSCVLKFCSKVKL